MSRVRLDVITFGAGTQIRDAISEAVVSDYAEQMSEGVAFPPVVLFHDGNHYYMADGFHRGFASQRVGFIDIDAEVKVGTKIDALWFALGANQANGHRMTRSDKTHAICLAAQAWPMKSQHDIARQIGCSQGLVSQVISTNHLQTSRADRVAGKDGKSYPSSKKDRSKRPGRVPPARDQKPSKTRAAVEARRQQMRELAATAHTSRQIASAVGMTEESCRDAMRAAGIQVPADAAIKGTHHHNATRIVETMVMDADNLTAAVDLIDFAALDQARFGEWVVSLIASKKALDTFIRGLMKEKQKHEAA